MDNAVFIIAIDNDLERIGFDHIIQATIAQALIIHASGTHEIHKSLFEHERAVVVVSADQLDIDNLHQLAALSKCFLVAKWLIVAETNDELFLHELIASFPDAGLILKTNKYDEIVMSISNTLSGFKYYCQEAELIANESRYRKREGASKRNLLTATELELVQLITQGKTAKEIADLRCLSYHTVNTHRKNIFRKLEINNVQELIKYALRNGLVDLTEYYI